jgi:hypothetical protein
MSDLKLQGFATRAEERMPLPDFAELEHRGRTLRRHRLTAVTAGAVACVLVAAGVAVLRDDSPQAVEPVLPPDDAQVLAEDYPGPVMETLDAGTYTIRPSLLDAYPVARITLPEGWNAWEGPNRFDVNDPGDSNEEALDEITWYVGILVLRVDGVASEPCETPTSADHLEPSAESLVRAVRGIPGYRITENVVPEEMFGHPATHFRLVPQDRQAKCDPNLFRTGAHGIVGGTQGVEHLWVVDVDGYPVLVESSSSGPVPPAVRREQAAAIDSIEFFFEE